LTEGGDRRSSRSPFLKRPARSRASLYSYTRRFHHKHLRSQPLCHRYLIGDRNRSASSGDHS
jgi:hypothetical protein